MDSKKAIRTQIKKIRSMLTAEQKRIKDKQIYQTIIHTNDFINANEIFIYLNLTDEVSTHMIIRKAWELGKKVAAPKVTGKEMEFYSFNSFDELSSGIHGILEPTGDRLISPKNTLVIMPGVAFDYDCHRIGYGGGYYDRYLTSHQISNTIALAYDCQIMQQIPYEDHDIKPTSIITEKQFITIKETRPY